ncbi:MAG: hypothetical protein HYU76_13385 [Betaproteobacteria bacterium]|nr:hypothetical protein [Betaproteobacteria bacterium]
MPETARALLAALLTSTLAMPFAGPASAQSKGGSGKIICWKDKSGKVVGCGDTVPPEYQESATKELDRRGVTRGTTESAEDAAKRKGREQELAKQKAEEQKKRAEQRRQDSALLATYTSENEIDQKRDRELQLVELQVSQLQVSLSNAIDRHNDAKVRSDLAQKDTRLAHPSLQDELAKAESEKQGIEQSIAGKEKEKEDIRKRYAEQKKRYLELRGGGGEPAPAAKPAPSAAAAPAKK